MFKSNCFIKNICIILSIFCFFAIPNTVSAGVNSNPGTSLKQSADMAGLEDKDINQTVGTFVGQILSMVGVLFFILVVYGGILWMTARGDTDQTSKAMKTIIAASIGIVLVLSAYAITNFVIGLTDNSNTNNNPIGNISSGNSNSNGNSSLLMG